MIHFTPWSALLGGVLIGLAASLLMLLNGRVAGISGIFAGVFHPGRRENHWRLVFLLGLLSVGVLTKLFAPGIAAQSAASAPGALVLGAGLLVGFGARLSNGCTSGHGVCGIPRLSPRSITATLTFMATGALTVFVLRHVL